MASFPIWYMLIFLKVPPLLMMALLWWAARPPANESGSEDDGGSRVCPLDGKRLPPSSPRRGCGRVARRSPRVEKVL